MALRNAQQVEAKAKQCAQAPDKTGYAAGQPYMAERTALNYDPKVQKDGNLTSTSTVIIKLKDKDGNPVAEGTQVREVAPLTVQQQKDVYPSKTRVEGFVERTDSTGQLKNPDYWQHTFTSKSGYVVKTQELVSGDKHLYWDARQTPQGVEIYTHQTGYFYGQ